MFRGLAGLRGWGEKALGPFIWLAEEIYFLRLGGIGDLFGWLLS